MYKWPKGRVIRTITLVVALIVGLDLGYNGWKRLSLFFAESQRATDAISGSIFAIAALAALIAGFVCAGFHKRAVDFLIEVEDEMTKVVWPSSRTLVQSTLWIAAMIVVLSAGIVLVDTLNWKILHGLIFSGKG